MNAHSVAPAYYRCACRGSVAPLWTNCIMFISGRNFPRQEGKLLAPIKSFALNMILWMIRQDQGKGGQSDNVFLSQCLLTWQFAIVIAGIHSTLYDLHDSVFKDVGLSQCIVCAYTLLLSGIYSVSVSNLKANAEARRFWETIKLWLLCTWSYSGGSIIILQYLLKG